MADVAVQVQEEEIQQPKFDIDAIVSLEELPIDSGSISAKAPESGKSDYTRVHYDNLKSALANLKALYRSQPKGTKIRINFTLTV